MRISDWSSDGCSSDLFADDRQLTRTLGREPAKDMASDYGRDPDQDARTFADRRGLSGEIRFAEPPERAKGEMPAAERGSPPQDSAEPTTIGRGEQARDGEGRRRGGPDHGLRTDPA